MGFSPGFQGVNEPGLLFQAVLKWSPRRASLAEGAQQIPRQGAVGITQKMRPQRRREGTEQAVQFSPPLPGAFVLQLG